MQIGPKRKWCPCNQVFDVKLSKLPNKKMNNDVLEDLNGHQLIL